MKNKGFKILLLLVFASVILFPAIFRTVRVAQGSVGCVYDSSTGATLGWIPADGEEHSVLRFRGYRQMTKGAHADKIEIDGKTFIVWNEPIHNQNEAELYAKYGWDYLPKIAKPLIDEYNRNSDVTPNPEIEVPRFFSENTEVKKYLKIKSVTMPE